MNISEPLLPERPRELLAELCTNIAGLAKTVHDLGAYGYTLANIQEMVTSSMARMNLPQEHMEAIVQAYDSWTRQAPQDHLDHECDVASGTRKAVAMLLGDRKSVQCAVMFRSGASFQGDLSETEWGGLRLEISASDGSRKVEQFFDYEDVCVVAREISENDTQPSLIVRS